MEAGQREGRKIGLPRQDTFRQSSWMRICHVSVSLKTGGLERVLAGLAAHTNREKFELDFVALREEGRFASEIRNTGARVELLSAPNRWHMVNRLRNFFRDRRIDIVHTHNTYPHLYGTLAARLARVPIVVNTRHGQRIGHGWKSKMLFRLAGIWVDRFVAVSDDAAGLCVKEDGLPAKKVSRIWNGIDPADFAFHGSTCIPLAICVARLAPEKDLATLIRATSIAIESVPELRLRIIGGGPLRPQLETLANELRLEGRVDFLGECENVPELLGSSGFYVSPSLSEGISLTILEAMAVGLPVIATSVGGNPEVVVEPETGILVPAGCPERLALAMVQMCNKKGDWISMGKAGRRRVVQCFDVRMMAENYQSLYKELLGSRSS